MSQQKRKFPSPDNELPFDFRIDRANFQRSQGVFEENVNADRDLEITRGSDVFKTAVYSKCMPHNSFGEVLVEDFEKLELSMRLGDAEAFADIPRAAGAIRGFVDPQAALAFLLEGQDLTGVPLAAAPGFQSEQASAEMVELYGMQLARDQAFSDIAAGTTTIEPEITALIAELNANASYAGITPVNRGNLFRGTAVGSIVGPYVSQFFLHPFNYGNLLVNPQVDREDVVGATTAIASLLAIQNCTVNPPPNRSGVFELVFNGLTGGSYVHNDTVIESAYNAANILITTGAPLDPNNPFLPVNAGSNQEGFVTLGVADIVTRLAHACQLALKGAWYQKWFQLRLRPEVMGLRVENQVNGGQAYGLPASLTGSGTRASAQAQNLALFGNNTSLLSLLFGEGSPAHPAYPAGHAYFAGASCTVLKAFFDTSVDWTVATGLPKLNPTGPNTTVAVPGDPLTIETELNKLAWNIATFRNWAGVHYRSDGDLGIEGGEAFAICYLRDVAAAYNLLFPGDFAGFTLNKFDGTPIVITPT